MKKLAHNGCLLLSKCWLGYVFSRLYWDWRMESSGLISECYFHRTGREMGRLSNDSDISTHHRDGSEKFHTRGCLWQGLQDKTQQGAGEKLNYFLLNSNNYPRLLNTTWLIIVSFSYGLIDMRTTFRLLASARQLPQARACGPHPFGHRWYLEWILESSQQRLLIKWKNQIMDRKILASIC